LKDAETLKGGGVKELQDQIREFCDEREWEPFHGPKDLAIGLVTEASELLQHFRFKTAEESATLFQSPSGREALEDEMADVLFFLLRMADLNAVNLSHALKNKMVKNAEKYPVERFRGIAKKYSEEF
jgi:NTP pyrophosphatase (non-canonical NTP hydrolase)